MIAVGTLIGLINGFFVARFKMPSFMVTLVSLMLFSSAGDLADAVARTSSTCPTASASLGSGDLVSVYFGEKVEARRSSDATFCPSSPIRW